MQKKTANPLISALKKGVIVLSCLVFLLSLFQCSSTNSRNFSSISRIQEENISKPDSQPAVKDYYEENFLRYSDFVYQNNIKTVLFNRQGWEFSTPIIELNTDEKLEMRFDDLDGDFKNYAYTIIHCNALWQPSDLAQYEYIQGFYEDQIRDYAFSRNAVTSYTHYNFLFPNDNMKPLITGNYLMKVFVDNDPEKVVITRRFMVFEQNISIEANVKQATNLNIRVTHQEVDFTLNTSLYPISNPYRDLRVVLMQNGRWDNAIINLKPRLVQGNTLIYDYEDGNVFRGGNEFRNFDIKSLRYRSMNVESINSLPNGWDVILKPDRNRRFLRYTTQNDINGQFLVKNDDFPNDFLEGDYVWVHFTLPYEKPFTDGNVYLMGEFTNWNMIPYNKMEYNYRDSQYEKKLLLKQGFYDYQYALLEDGKEIADESIFEGTHSVTENTYSIYVYYRKPGEIFDSLIGIQHVNSGI
jgi:hypothetical protein